MKRRFEISVDTNSNSKSLKRQKTNPITFINADNKKKKNDYCKDDQKQQTSETKQYKKKSKKRKGRNKAYFRRCHACLINCNSLSQWNDHLKTKHTDPKKNKRHCECCKVLIFGDENWSRHVSGRKHNNKIKKIQQRILAKNISKPTLVIAKNNKIKNGNKLELMVDLEVNNIQIPKTRHDHLTYYKKETENSNIKSVTIIKSAGINKELSMIDLNNLNLVKNINLNGIKIKYESIEEPYSLSMGFPPQKIDVSLYDNFGAVFNIGEKLKQLSQLNEIKQKTHFMTYSNTLIQIFNMIAQCKYQKIEQPHCIKNPAFIGMWLNGSSIYLTNIHQQRSSDYKLCKTEIYKLLVGHLLRVQYEENEDIDIDMKHNENSIKPMNFKQCLTDDTSIGSVQKLEINEASILCITPQIDVDTNFNLVHIAPVFWRTNGKNKEQLLKQLGINEVMKHWIIMYCNDIKNALFVCLHKKTGAINDILIVSKQDIEQQYALIIKQFLSSLSRILKWIIEIQPKLDQNRLYALSLWRNKPNLNAKRVKLTLHEIDDSDNMKECIASKKCKGFFYSQATKNIECI